MHLCARVGRSTFTSDLCGQKNDVPAGRASIACFKAFSLSFL